MNLHLQFIKLTKNKKFCWRHQQSSKTQTRYCDTILKLIINFKVGHLTMNKNWFHL